MINLPSPATSEAVQQQLEDQKQRLHNLEAELSRVTAQFQNYRQYTEALEVDFEHAIGQLTQLNRLAS